MKRSALFYLHQRGGARFGECHGWEMPFSFRSPEAEESQVREHVGLTDLSYRTKFDMNWNMPLPNGEPALGNTVTLKAELTLVAQDA